MNKTLKQLMILVLAGVTLCGPVMAAPRGGKGRAPHPAPRHQTAKRPLAPKHHALKRQTHHRPTPKHHHEHNKVHHHGDKNNGWVTLGAAVVGGLVGGLLGACN